MNERLRPAKRSNQTHMMQRVEITHQLKFLVPESAFGFSSRLYISGSLRVLAGIFGPMKPSTFKLKQRQTLTNFYCHYDK